MPTTIPAEPVAPVAGNRWAALDPWGVLAVWEYRPGYDGQLTPSRVADHLSASDAAALVYADRLRAVLARLIDREPDECAPSSGQQWCLEHSYDLPCAVAEARRLLADLTPTPAPVRGVEYVHRPGESVSVRLIGLTTPPGGKE